MRSRSQLIKISHSLVIAPKPERNDFMGVTSIHERDREFSMRGIEFTALMLHQCAAMVAVNLQIDQTAEPKGSEPYLKLRAQQSRKLSWFE